VLADSGSEFLCEFRGPSLRTLRLKSFDLLASKKLLTAENAKIKDAEFAENLAWVERLLTSAE
jgi:hypothetical protein